MAALDICCLRGSPDFMEAIKSHMPEIRVHRAVRGQSPGEKHEWSKLARVFPNFPRPSPILKMLYHENNVQSDPPLDIEFCILWESSVSLRTLRLKHIPLTNKFQRLTTLTSSTSHYYINLRTLLAFLAEINISNTFAFHAEILWAKTLVPGFPPKRSSFHPSRYLRS